MESVTDEPDDSIASPDTEQCSHDKSYHFSPGRPLPLSESPVLIQEKAVHGAQAIGEGIVSQEHRGTGGGEQEQKTIQGE